MGKPQQHDVIHLRGVRQNNLKNIDLDLPLGKLIAITGLSGSGKSSLAFETLYAEGQRRYIETFSPYARQFFDRMDKPQVDSIKGIPPAIALEQRNTVRSTRSTVGTMTEICDHMKIMWHNLASLHCRQCGKPVQKDGPAEVWADTVGTAQPQPKEQEIWIVFDTPMSEKVSLAESLSLIEKQGYQRLVSVSETDQGSGRGRTEVKIIRIDEAASVLAGSDPKYLTIIQDRVKLASSNRSRFVEACEQAYHFGKGKLRLWLPEQHIFRSYSNRLHCSQCDLEYRESVAALFSFNNPLGACPTCRGFGRTITIDYNLAIPDRSLSISEGVIKPWKSGMSAECQQDLLKFCKLRKVPVKVSFNDLPPDVQAWVIDGDPDYGKDSKHEWPKAWYGVKGYFRWLESKSYKMHVRVLLSRYRIYQTCGECHGKRFRPEPLWYKVSDRSRRQWNLAEFYRLSVSNALNFIEELRKSPDRSRKSEALTIVLNEVRARLHYLDEVGLGYLTLDRSTRTLSGGETERVNLTTCLGTRLVNTLFVLDEPSVGLHARDTARLVGILKRLRDVGNTVVTVEHDSHVIGAADHIVDLGPGRGESGGRVVFQGTGKQLLRSSDSLTGRYLSDRVQIKTPPRRPVETSGKKLLLSHAQLNNLRDLTVEFPLNRFICVTGVSGSGKTSLVRGVLMPKLESKQTEPGTEAGEEPETEVEEEKSHSPPTADAPRSPTRLAGTEHLSRAIMVDQSTLGKTPRSNPAVYIGAFDHIRELFGQSELAQQSGLKASSFSFNSIQGQCEACRGAGFEKIEMQFLSDVFNRCPACNGRRYRSHILEIKLSPPSCGETKAGKLDQNRTASTKKTGQTRKSTSRSTSRLAHSDTEWSIADLLDSTVDEVVRFLGSFGDSKHARRAIESLRLLQDVGLGYLRAGQPINTLSGGESQRIKLVSHLAEFARKGTEQQKPTMFIFDEPTTGLHFDDIAILLQVFQHLVEAGHTIIVVEHNLDVIKCADWVIDLGPEAGDQGGQLVVQGTPETVATCPQSHTGQALIEAGIFLNLT